MVKGSKKHHCLGWIVKNNGVVHQKVKITSEKMFLSHEFSQNDLTIISRESLAHTKSKNQDKIRELEKIFGM